MSVVFPINPDDRYEEYTATAGQTLFAVPFPFQDDNDITVVKVAAADGALSTLTLTTHYTLSGAGTPGPGSMTLVTGATVGDKYRLIGNAVLDRLTSIVRDGRYSSLAQDDEHDRHRLIHQELKRDLARSVKMPYGVAGPELAPLVAGKLIIVNAAGDGLEMGPTADEIANAQTYALAAAQSASDADADRVATQALYDLFIASSPNANPLTYAQMEALPVSTTQAYLKQDGFQGWFSQVASADHTALAAVDTSEYELRPYSADSNLSWLRVRKFGDLFKTSEFNNDIALAVAVAQARGGGVVEINVDGTLAPSAGISVPVDVSLVGLGADKTKLDFSGVSSGLIDGYYGLSKVGGGLTALPSFTSISPGDRHITFDSAHGLVPGDIICVYDSANGSFLPLVSGYGGRDYYRRGQRARVVELSGTTVYVDQAFRAAYASGSTNTVYKQASTYGRIGGLLVDMEGCAVATNSAARVSYGDRVHIDDLHCAGGAYYGLALNQCYEVRGSGIFRTDFQTAEANSYPLSVNNSAHTHFSNFTAAGKWNGVGTGGDDIIGGIQSYGTLFENFTASGSDAAGCDIHGNAENTRFRRGRCRNGVSLGGLDTVYEDCVISDDDYIYAVAFSEVAGGRQAIVGGSITARRANYTGRSTIDGAGGPAFRAAFEEVFIEIKTKLTAPLTRSVMGFIHDGSGAKISHDIDIELIGSLSLVGGDNFLFIDQLSGGVGPGTLGRLRVANLPSGVAYSEFRTNYSCSLYDYPEQRGTVDLTTTAASAVVSGSLTYPHAYPVTPKFIHSPGIAPNGEACVSQEYTAATASGYRLTLFRMSGANFTAGHAASIKWSARL